MSNNNEPAKRTSRVSLTFIHMQMKGLIFYALPETFSWSVTSTVNSLVYIDRFSGERAQSTIHKIYTVDLNCTVLFTSDLDAGVQEFYQMSVFFSTNVEHEILVLPSFRVVSRHFLQATFLK